MSRAAMIAGIMSCVALSAILAADGPEQPSAAGLALESLFNPQRAPAQKSMGLLQRSFLDLVESSHRELQIAFVIDGTDSMAADIAGVRAAVHGVVSDLRHYKDNHVSFALIVYRDTGAPSGEVVRPLSQFTSDEKLLADAFSKVAPETGAPYFLELPDLGVHEALDKLNWAQGTDTTRWVLLFGDAPPYDPDFVDKEHNSGARRRYDTDLLVNMAKRKGVQISCVLCKSREEDRAIYERVLDKTRQFMNTLATNTDGLMLDLSYPDIRAALIEAARKQRVERQRIGTISRDEIDAARKAAAAASVSAGEGQRLRIAVLPHLPLAQITFDPTDEAVQMATELRHKFRLLPRTEVRSPVDIERALRRVKAGDAAPDQWLQALAAELRVEYVVWGEYRRSQGAVSVKSAIYSKLDGQKVIESTQLTNSMVPPNQIAGALVRQLTLSKFDRNLAPELYVAFAPIRTDTAAHEQLFQPMVNNEGVRTELLTGFEALEQSLAMPIGNATGKTLLDQAERALTRAAEQDVRNPSIHMLLASCFFNLAQAAAEQGRTEEANAKGRQFTESLKRAFRERDNAPAELLKMEIAADYALLVKKDIREALNLYHEIASAPHDARLQTALRAHWMLAGIYSGDWGVESSFIDAGKAREQLVLILAHWPDSSEAAFIKSHLRWSDEKGRNQFEHFPLHNKAILPET